MINVGSGLNVIPFVGQVDDDERGDWLNALSLLLPGERLVPFSNLTNAEKTEATIAIVANPQPNEIEQLPNLLWIHSVWAGVERMLADLQGASFDIVRLIDPELSRTMAEAALAWTLYLHRDMPAYYRQQQDQNWKALPYKKPSQKTVGVLGLGSLGNAASKTLANTGFNVVGWSRNKKNISGLKTFEGPEGLKSTFAQSDIIVCLLPLTDETRGLIGQELLQLMPSGGGIINFARGPIINKTDLITALDDGHLAHAVLDVFDQEPLPASDPFWVHPHVTVLPHISAPTDVQTASEIVSTNIKNYRATGQVPACVDRLKGY
ncbi:MAG: glyoxylate/hydroxypyruvate reductase A [Sneathiella sp.]